MGGRRVFVVVLGDVARSPRMQYHALSLATEGYLVTVVGHSSSPQPLLSLSTHPSVSFQHVSDSPDFKKYLPSLLAYVLRAVWLSTSLLLALMLAGIADAVLVQNPPAIPALGVCWLYARLTRAKYIIDWHNYAHTILALSLTPTHLLVRVSQAFEFAMGRRSNAILCVTNSMRLDLEKKGISAVTLYDCPAEHFKPLDVSEKHELLKELGQQLPVFVTDCSADDTVLTSMVDGTVCLRDDRPGVLISSTSWTEDEDFSLLLHALQDYEEAKLSGLALPRLLVVITGKGPLKEFYTAVMARREWQHIHVITPWLTAEHYPKLIACGDLGVCLHTSSSGLDLPMKVVDMFGCGLPVAAVNFKCLHELVKHEKHGTVFNTAAELSEQLQAWFLDFPAPPTQEWRKTVHANVMSKRANQWHTNWLLTVGTIFKELA